MCTCINVCSSTNAIDPQFKLKYFLTASPFQLLRSMAATSSTAIVPQILDGKHDYKDWSVRVKTYLLSKDLWDVVETTSEPPEQEGVWDFKVWRKNNAEALHAIQLSCGPLTFPSIRDKTTAKAAWDTLEAQFNREESKLSSMAAESNRVETQDEIQLRENQAFFDAVRRGDWPEAKEFLTLHPNAKTAVDSWGTALHSAARFGHKQIVEELVRLMTEKDLEITDGKGWTALAHAATDNIKMVECMVTKNKELLAIAESSQMTPILVATLYDRWDIVRYLYSYTERKDLMPDKGPYGSALVSDCLQAKQFDIAWELLQHCPRLACTQGFGNSPIFSFATVPSAFLSGTSFKFWQRWIYNCIQIEPARSISDFRINVQYQENEQGINRIYELKLTHVWSRQIMDCMCDVIKQLNDEEMIRGLVYEALFEAVCNGTVELVISLCKAKPDLLFRTVDGRSDGKNIFHYAVECRQEKVYSLIHGVGIRNLLTTWIDDSDNNILHYAGLLSPLAKFDRISGAALQMQRERQWYKEVESIVVKLSGASTENKEGRTPSKLFTETHKKLHEEGQKWMKETASSYTVVSALIITIMFAAVFTVPGGNNQETGFPIFLNKKLFMVFIVSDAISLFSSTTSVLMFLGILTSRYAEDDFLKSLPRKMIIGLSTLFISIATMMVAFSSAVFIMLQDKLWITYPIIFLAGVPVILFIWMQFPLLLEIFSSTYCGRKIFNRKVKRWI
ncbi:uncharacterized protein LOC126612233 isoform X2 [Malus sylvestris]|uniref:uncharacterized protein LOC126612233 isoform X2 n=1 Tax=Malus sylvestris TaxID=3752 RepID=UPI0021ABA7C4|nr:uncharacterized protein LOC126612233 isoform X2 [Malus sylvestris]